MANDDFVHLHLYTGYSLLDSTCRIDRLMSRVQALGMSAVAITDHGNMFGVVEFYKEAKARGIKPIIGCDVYMAPGSRFEKPTANISEDPCHLILLARNETGYHNLIQLATAAHLEGVYCEADLDHSYGSDDCAKTYYKPCIDKTLLARHAAGLIGLSGYLKSELMERIINDQLPEARLVIDQYRNIFEKGAYYLEIQDHGIDQPKRVNRELVSLAREMGLPLVATNDVRYLAPEHAHAHECLICGDTWQMPSPDRRRYPNDQFYLKSAADMRHLFAELPEAIENTRVIADQCDLDIGLGKARHPVFEPPPGTTRETYLRRLCELGLKKNFGFDGQATALTAEQQAALDRMDYELKIIEETGFTCYFLILRDITNHIRQQGIPAICRGTVAGSLVGYLLEISAVDPIRCHLMFDLFLNPERLSVLDTVIDVSDETSVKIVENIRLTYGERRVASASKYSVFSARHAVMHMARSVGLFPYALDLLDMLPASRKITLSEAFRGSVDLRAVYDSRPDVRDVLDNAAVLEGVPAYRFAYRHHVVICPQPLKSIVPLTSDANGVGTQYPVKSLNDLGLLTVNCSEVRTVTVIQKTFELIKRFRGLNVSLDQLPLDDPGTYELLNCGDTIGVLQLEFSDKSDLCRKWRIQRLADLIVLIAIYRPGLKELIPSFIARKTGWEKIGYGHPLLKKICAETYGIMIYQEQVTQAAQELAGYTLSEAVVLWETVMGKQVGEIAEKQNKFVERCAEKNSIPKAKAEELFDVLVKSVGYGLAKAHVASYALSTYQTAYLKTHYPFEFMAALLCLNSDSLHTLGEKEMVHLGEREWRTRIESGERSKARQEIINEARCMLIKVIPVDVNNSPLVCCAEASNKPGVLGTIRLGLADMRWCSDSVAQAAIDERTKGGPFKDLLDFCKRIDARTVEYKLTLPLSETLGLIDYGAFDFTGLSHEQLQEQAKQVLKEEA